MTTTAEYLQKADQMSADLLAGGQLQTEQMKTFYEVAISQSELIKRIYKVEMGAPEWQLDKTIAPGTVLQPGTEGVVLPDAARSKLGFDKVTMQSRELVGEFQWSYHLLEDNIERGRFKDTLVRRMGEVAGNDWEDLLINGDTSIVVPALDENDVNSIAAWKRARLLKVQEGLVVKATSHVVDAGGSRLNAGILKSAQQTMPIPFRKKLQFFTSDNAVADYWETVAARQTALGDQAYQETGEAKFRGMKVTPLDIWPSTLGVDADRTVAMLFDPKNVVWGVQRDMTIRTMEDIRRRCYVTVFSCRVAMQIQHEPAVVKIENVQNSADV
jgi:hypothetical protein